MGAATRPVAAVLDAHRRGVPLLLRTGGTSGAPRGVVRTTASWWESFPAYADLLGLDAGARVWVPGPLSATLNLFAAVQAADAGAALLSGPRTRPDGATHAVLTPSRLAGDLDALPAGLHVVTAGDRLSPALAERAADRGVLVSHYYGAAELSFVAWGSHAEDLHPFPGVEVQVRDGVIWCRSPFHALRPDGANAWPREADGWASVGDHGLLDGARLVVHGRGGEAVTTAGATVLVAEVEAQLVPHARGQVWVVGVPHPDLGQVLAGVLSDPADRPVVALARDLPMPAHRPRRWFLCPEPPLTAAGKVDRDALASLAASGSLEAVSSQHPGG